MSVVYERHACPVPAGYYASGTIWRCECGRGWYRNSNHPENVYPLWNPVLWWHWRKRRLMDRVGKG